MNSAQSKEELPTLRWGIIGTGLIATWFVTDLTLPRPFPTAIHKISAIGSSSLSKARDFASKCIPFTCESPTCYGSYDEVYNSPAVDIIYIATPHAFHLQNCLSAIAAGKHVLCEKPLALNAKQARQIIAAARFKGVFVMEGMWTRFFPLVRTLQKLLHEEKRIGDVRRVFCDFGLDMPLSSLPETSRLKDVSLGAGSLLDIGIYSLTWGLMALEPPLDYGHHNQIVNGRKFVEEEGERKKPPQVYSAQTLEHNVDVASSMILFYPESGRQGILTSSLMHKTDDKFFRIEGTMGTVLVSGDTASMPSAITIRMKAAGAGKDLGDKKADETNGGKGFYYEADAVAVDISNGRLESEIMPLGESLRVLEIMDQVRKGGGAKFPQDDQL
ncbi:hypothetical protein DL95DRAFT_479964 [Leptodontidium sp. 2 PMI_412]|nr:hypothetical protein DL95DRAFT_479964 [Leptodontidium sp. 2 PMI_412]